MLGAEPSTNFHYIDFAGTTATRATLNRNNLNSGTHFQGHNIRIHLNHSSSLHNKRTMSNDVYTKISEKMRHEQFTDEEIKIVEKAKDQLSNYSECRAIITTHRENAHQDLEPPGP